MRNAIVAATTLLFTAVLFLSGCSRISVTSDFDPSADFSAIRSYAWHDRSGQEAGDPRLDNSIVDKRVRRAIDDALVERGMKQVARADADILVNYHLGVDTRIDVTESPGRFGYGWGSGWGVTFGGGTVVDQYEEGTLLIDFIDVSGENLLWRGAGTSRLQDRGTPQARDQYMRETVDAILAKFPPEG